jgi:membrane protease YdiL (CAAX protease family)
MKNKLKNSTNPWIFFIITFGLTWIFWIPAALLNKDFSTFSVMLLVILGGIVGKVIPATLLPYLTFGREGWIDYWQRAIDFKRISSGWWMVTLLSPPLFAILGILTDIMMGGKLPSFEIIANFLSAPHKILPFALFILVFGPLPEELGWAGYELDRLQAKYSALTSSLIPGIFWGLWHLPLFFINGS